MRDWTKPLGVLLAAASSVCISVAIHAQETPPGKAPAPAKSDEVDPFAKSALPSGAVRDLTKDELQVTEGMVEVHVNDQSIISVLQTISIQTKRNIIASKNVTGSVTANLYGVTVDEALDAILHPNGYAYVKKGNFTYVYTLKELEEQEKAARKIATETFRLSYVPADVVKDMIRPALSPESIIALTKAPTFGLPTAATEAGGNSLAIEDTIVISDYPENLDKVRKIIKDLDRRPQQILVEATIMVTKLSDTNSLGVDFTLLGGVDFQTLSGTTNGSSGALGGGIIDDSKAGNITSSGYNAVGTRTLNNQGLANQGLNIGLSTSNIAVFVNALESITDSTVLANPKVLTLNKQPGIVIVGRKDGYITSTTTSTSTVQTVEFLETGTRLIFRPYIAEDGFIRMELHPEDSTGSVTVNGTFALPSKQTTEVTTNVLVRDGHTIVIGGLFREDNSVTKSQVPLLGDIPFAGQLFKKQTDIGIRQEVIVLITPHIIKDYSMYSEVSEQRLKEVDIQRVGLRRGMMPWSRDRMAEMSYKKARTEMAKTTYNRHRAMWYLDCATNLNPMFLEAYNLKEKLSGEQISESDNSNIRHFLTQAIMEDIGPAAPAAPAPVMIKPEEPADKPVPAAPKPMPKPDMKSETKTGNGAPKTEVKITEMPPAAPTVKELPPASGVDNSNK